ncbi:MAG: response regulator, partial [Acidobacteria bacterium]|nr:response regulator [Acidobacteriota bacterium]
HLPRTPILAMTAHAMPGDRERCLESGMDDYISKPISLTVLENTLSRWIDLNRVAPTETRELSEAAGT